jgi:UV DNA damage repair endonuclease
MTTIPRIGFACKTVQPHPKRIFENIADLNFKGTTITWVKNQPRDVAERKLWEITEHNVQALKKLIEYVGGLDEHRRMVRIGSDIFSGYTHPELQFFWSQRSVLDMAARTLAEAGDIARDRNVRLSMHPGQFVVLASDTETIVNNSILEFEYHTLIAKLMGYGSSWHDHGFKINVHISGRQGPSGIRKALTKLSPEACNLITIENEENNYNNINTFCSDNDYNKYQEFYLVIDHSKQSYSKLNNSSSYNQ